MHPKETDWSSFYSRIKKATGLDLHQYKANQLQRRTLSMAENQGCTNLEEFGEWVVSKKENVAWFLDKLAINVSEMFRNPEKWEVLRTKVIPKLLESNLRLKCWSAGCSYGAEAYSLAMTLDLEFAGVHQIIGTDIDQSVLAQAAEGFFTHADVKGVPKQYRDKYLAEWDGGWKACGDLKRYLKFKKHNLLADPFERNYDLILCRNVVIYFTDEAKSALYERFFNALRPGGYLFVGSTERIFRSEEIGFQNNLPFFYQKPDNGVSEWRNAS
ncbi:MAG: protein-glutamate O-methyltransferase CheR [Fimbriimonadaceae bacterium]|nr:protein-glutamate O-methyltransferase CheR [Fimbriimonadaceae bacterium]QYK56181.1 MAG: protein-glutamate O-methyltransferase CheR [Fimbriimonadaceae bacterium]